MRRGYKVESIERALTHHVQGGRLISWGRSDLGGRRRWLVQGHGQGYEQTFNDDEIVGVCFGLASAHYGLSRVDS